MRIAPRTLLCANEYRIRSGRTDIEFGELKELCTSAEDDRSVAIGLAGVTLSTQLEFGPRMATGHATELVRLLESIGDPNLTVALSVAYLNTLLQAGQLASVFKLASRVIQLSGGDEPGRRGLISVSPLANALAIRGTVRWCLGLPGWREDSDQAIKAATAIPAEFRSGPFWIVYLMGIPNGVLLPEVTAVGQIAQILSAAEQFGEQITIEMAQIAYGILLTYREGSERDTGDRLLEEVCESARHRRFTAPNNLPFVEIHVARVKARLGDVGGAIALARTAFDHYFRSRELIWVGATTALYVESLLQRGSEVDLREARDATAKLAAVPTEPGCVLNEIWLLRLRALLAQAEGDDLTYRENRDRYRKMANDLGFEGHMAWAAEMV